MSDDDWGNSDEDIPVVPKAQVLDDWDDEPTFKAPKPDSDSDWGKDSDDEEEKEESEVKKGAEIKKEEKNQPSKDKLNIKNKNVQQKADIYVPLDDPAAEKLRLKKLQEQGEDDAIDDLFGGFTVKKDNQDVFKGTTSTSNAASSSSGALPITKKAEASLTTKKKEEENTYDVFFEEFHFQNLEKVKDFCGQMLAKVEEIEKKAHMKGAVSNFLIKILQLCQEKCSKKDLEELEKKLKEIQRARKVEATAKQAGKKQKNDETNKHKQWDAQDELDERWADDDDWEEGDWEGDDWTGGDWGQGGEWQE